MIGDQNIEPTPSGLPSPHSTPQKELRPEAEPFGPVIFSYSRKQALADGLQVDVSQTAAEAGFRWPVFLTRTVFDAYVAVPEGVEGQDDAGRPWDILNMLFVAVRCSEPSETRIRLPSSKVTWRERAIRHPGLSSFGRASRGSTT